MFKFRLTLGIALLMVVGYDLAVRTHAVHPGDGVTQPQTNTIRLEQYALDHRPGDVVLVGSSLVANLQREPREGDVVSLGLEGHSPLTGLHAVVVSGAKPRAVVVEVADPIWKGVDQGFLTETFGPWSPAKRWVPSLQTRYSPMVVVHGWVKKKLSKGDAETIADQALLSLLVDQEREARQAPFSREEEKGNAAALKSLQADVSELERRGVQVRFVRIPREPRVDETPRNLAAVKAVQSLYGPEKWISITPAEPVQTRDALHMVRAQADEFRAGLLHALNQNLLCQR